MKTNELNSQEMELALEIGSMLQTRVGKVNATSSGEICHRMGNKALDLGLNLSGVLIRRIVNWLRLTGTVENLCSSGNGYFVAKDIDEMRECCDSLRMRMAHQYQTERALRKQLNSWINRPQQTIPFEV